ncbi:13137_t:CDS:2 [Dentiscutata heterogama]|uniref:13137_t:CDS:1 n=1 Tax=Dentiscutata heterogama TaxID=1316150 RepID=A0ACA9K0U9_9GLOM|nr:13137_t:CDS:2 [Dentiscutata heterogama]
MKLIDNQAITATFEYLSFIIYNQENKFKFVTPAITRSIFILASEELDQSFPYSSLLSLYNEDTTQIKFSPNLIYLFLL